MRPPLDDWIVFVRESALSLEGGKIALARANALSFSMPAEQAEDFSEAELSQLIESAYAEYQVKLVKAQAAFWFYAWLDELAGSLRCSATACDSQKDLPFGRELAVTDDPGVIAREFLSCTTLDGIKFSEMKDVIPGMEHEPLPPLNVFARRLAP